jgi:predicted nucleotidyltransferase
MSEIPAILHEFKKAAIGALAGQIRLIRLFGSYARGDADAGSDIDLLLVIGDPDGHIRERLRQIRYDVMWRHDFQPFLSLLIVSESEYARLVEERSSLLANIQTGGVTLWPD